MKLIENSTQYILSGESECKKCKGTSLYFGMAERDGARIVCYSCKGLGKVKTHLVFEKFFNRKVDKGAKRVYENGMGYCITHKDITDKEGNFFPFSQYGCSYAEWLNGKKPLPLEFLGCPYLETRQGLQSKDKNNLYKSRCKNNLGCGNITDCKLYNDKQKCWKIFNK